MEARNTVMFMWCKETIHHLVYSRLLDYSRVSISLSLKSVKWCNISKDVCLQTV